MLRWFVLSTVFFTTGCASMFMKGGVLVPEDFKPKVLVKYKAEGQVPPGAKYSLVRSDEGVGILEYTGEGSVLFTNHWRTETDDHYFGWVATSHGYEFVIPIDRTQPGKKYVYPARTYDVETVEDSERPVSQTRVSPVATLTPVGQKAAAVSESRQPDVAPMAPVPSSPPPSAASPSAPASKSTQTIIKTSDGKSYRGRVITETSKGFLFKPLTGETMVIEFEKVVEMNDVEAR
jgi:hypothetical protein